jgi:hypothetical protein
MIHPDTYGGKQGETYDQLIKSKQDLYEENRLMREQLREVRKRAGDILVYATLNQARLPDRDYMYIRRTSLKIRQATVIPTIRQGVQRYG